jgi:hypothetical protein
MLTLDLLTQDEFRGNVGKLPVCQLLNDKSKPGLFIKMKDAKLAGWTEKNQVEVYTHTYNDESSEAGYFFSNPKIHVLGISPRLVEVTKKGAQDKTFPFWEQGTLIANYETPEGQVVHHNKLTKGCTTLRTYYLIQLLDAENEFFHKLPLLLSVKGAAAAEFGKAYTAFCQIAEAALTQLKSSDGTYLTLNSQARAVLIFNPKFKWVLVGDKDKSPVCAVESFLEPSGKNEVELNKSFNLAKSKQIMGTQKSFQSFTSTALKQLEQLHPVPENIDLGLRSALPPSDVDW